MSAPGAAAFRGRVIGLSFAVSGPALAIVLAALGSLLELTGEQWAWFFAVTLVYALVATPVMAAYQWRMLGPVAAWLDGEATPSPARVAGAACAVGSAAR